MQIIINIALSSSIYYFTIINLLYFNLDLLQKILMYLIIIGGLVVTTIAGNCMILLMLGCIYIYLNRIKKNKIPNLIILIYGYVFDAVIDNLFTLGFRIIGIEVSNFIFWYLIGMNIILFILTFFLKRIVLRLLEFPPNIAIQIAVFLLVCLSIFIFNIIVGEKIGYSDESVFYNSVLFMLYFYVFTRLVLILVSKVEENNDVILKNESYKNLQVYTYKIEKAYNKNRSIRHDYMNIMLAMKDYIDQGDLIGIKDYFYNNIMKIAEEMQQNKNTINCLTNIHIIELKSIISSKTIYAMEMGIDVKIEVEYPIEHVNMKVIDLIRVIGIFIDNAIEASIISTDKKVHIICIKNDKCVQFIVENSYSIENILYDSSKRKYVSTKGKNRGIGLNNVDEILLRYDNIILNTSAEIYFKQHLIILN